MIKKFFAITLKDQEKYQLQPKDSLICHYITMISPRSEGDETLIYGESQKDQFLLATIKTGSSKVSIVMNEDNITSIYCVGNGVVDLTGYSMQTNDQKDQVSVETDDLYNDDFKALVPNKEENLVTDKMSKKKQKELDKLKQKLNKQ